jgi:hypothetical protein
MTETITQTVYFSHTGVDNTDRTIELAANRGNALGLKTVLVATTRGETGVRVVRQLNGFEVIAVTHSTGYKSPDIQELTEGNREVIVSAGGNILTCQHALGGVNRAVRKKFSTYQLDEIIAYTLRIFGQGMKVIAEMALMAADAGMVRTDIPIIGIAGTGRGADTAAVILPTNAQTFFDLRILEVICCPSPKHPSFDSPVG